MTGARAEVTITGLAHGGGAVGRLADGRAVFVWFAAPGDRVAIRIVEEKRRFARGRLLEVLAPGPARVAAPCPVFGRCGGCQWQHVAPEAQREAKRTTVARALAPLLAPGVAVEGCEAAAPPFGYRWRARLSRAGGRLGYRALRSHEVVDVASCPLLEPALDRALQAERGRGPDGELRAQLGADGQSVSLAGPGSPAPAPVDLAAPGEPPFLVAAGGFAQPGRQGNERLRALVRELAGATGARVLELHAGAGNFTRDLARAAAELVAVEAVASAAALGERNVRACAPGARVRFVAGEAAATVGALDGPFDVAVLDPPREGAAAEVAALVRRAPLPGRIVYVACDPQTLARDLRTLCASGYRLVRAVALDLMPQTFHVETVALLER